MRKLLFLSSILLIGALCAILGCGTQSSTNSTNQASSGGPATREQILKLFDAIELKKQMSSMTKTMRQNMQQMRQSAMRGITPTQAAEFEKLDNELYDKMLDADALNKMVELIIPVYQRHFSGSDVDGLTSFYSTALGQKLLHEQPAILEEYMPKVMSNLQQRIPALMEEMHYSERMRQIASGQ